MAFFGQQVGDGGAMGRLAPWLVGMAIASLACIAGAACVACEGAPARSKPWRHGDRDAEATASPEIASRVARAGEKKESRRKRVHLRVAVAELPSASLPGAAGSILWGAVFEPLLPRLATATLSPTATALTIELASAIATHDGKTLTASDVRFSLALARRAGGGFADDLRDVISIDVLSSDRLRLRMRRANGYVLRALEEIPIARVGGRAGTGPFAIAEQTAASMWLEPFAASAITTESARRGTIELVRERSASRALARVQVGDLDVARDRRARRSRPQGARSVVLRPARFRYLSFNARRTLFADAEVRRAASLVIDRQALAADGHHGMAVARTLPLWPGGPMASSALNVESPDLRAASELLDRAGWTRGKGVGARERDKQKLIAVAVTANAADKATSLVFDQLRASGFVLDVRELGREELARALEAGDFDLAVLEWSGFRDWDLSPILESRGRDNIGAISSTELDSALDLLRSAPSSTERAARMEQLVRAFDQVVPIVTLTQPTEHVLLSESTLGGEQLRDRLDLRLLRRAPSED